LFGGTFIRLVGGTIAYKLKFQLTVACSLMEAAFNASTLPYKITHLLYLGSIFTLFRADKN
jgi:hypothetical protein